MWSQLTRFPTPQIPDFPRGKHLISCYCKPAEWPITPWTDIKWPSHRYNTLLDFLVHTCYSCLLLKRRHDAVNHRNWINVQAALYLLELYDFIWIWWARFMIFLKPRTNVLISFHPLRCKLILFKAVAPRLALQRHMFSFLSKETLVLNICFLTLFVGMMLLRPP